MTTQIRDPRARRDAPAARAQFPAQRILQILCADAWFSELPERLQRAIVAESVCRRVAANALVYAAGDPPTGMFAVLSGGVRLVHHSESGKVAFYRLLVAGDWFGTISEIDGGSRFSDAVADDDDTVVLQLGHAAFHRLYRDDPEAHRAFIALICLNLRTTLAMMVENHSAPPREHLARLLVSIFTRPAGPPGTTSRLTQEALAAMTGLSRQTVSKVLHQFSREGLIALRYGRIDPLDLDSLASIARER